MNRYLLAAVLGAIAFLTLLGIGNSQDLLRRSRSSISATPSSAATSDNLAGIDGAGQNVLRQTSPEAISILADGTPAQPTLNPGATDPNAPTPTDPNATPPVPPSTTPPATPETPPPNDQEAIPALW